MIIRPRLEDAKIIGYYLGKIILGFSLTMLLPMALGVSRAESAPALDFLIAFLVSLLCGMSLTAACRTVKSLNWMQGMAVISLSWLAVMFLGAVPLYLSGHWACYLDACFDAMSGISTTGLAVVSDLDHLSTAHNLWRHLIMFIGGQGVAVVALSLFIRGASGAFTLYVGEARDEKLLPNVVHTSRLIWILSLVFLALGTLALGITGLCIGLDPFNAFFHGACVFMAGFDTAGFAPNSQNILFYHSIAYEAVIMVIIVFGALNFNLHYRILSGHRGELLRNIETRAFLLSVGCLFFIVAAGLRAAQAYPDAVSLFRKGFFQFLSGHTGTGYMTMYARQFIKEWGDTALFGLIIAMGVGGCICSTAGGIKMFRLGIAYKALREDIKKLILPVHAVSTQKFHHIQDLFVKDSTARAALIIILSYIVLYLLGALAGMACGYPFLEALFESTSAGANVGLSCGITAATMPAFLKYTYIIQMWAGRLEFMSVFTLIGMLVAAVKGK